ncbi:MAG: adenylate/guanylate cyclase domain-containing protein [Pyrinomonadaceae bacterium]|nr:adenylate/guanylate cyclase domain-containing protein [Pyrinomonadaceae bacterium]
MSLPTQKTDTRRTLARRLYPRSFSVQSKLIIAFVLLTLVAIGTVAWIGYVSARESLRASAESQLMGLQRSKAALVQNILKSARNEVLSLSSSPGATNAARELLAAYRQLDREPFTPEMEAEVRRFYEEEFEPELRERSAIEPPNDSLLPTTKTGWYLHYHYLVKGPKPYGLENTNRSSTDKSAYAQAMAKWLPLIEGSIQRLGQEGVILVDPETLEVFFSLKQSSIVGTNLINGPYAASQLSELARSLRNSQNVDDYRVADFETYYPAFGRPKAFVGTPVFDGPRMNAIMMLRLSIEPISNALSGNRQWEADGLGKTGEVYLLGPDQTMRTDSRFLIEDRNAFLAGLRRSRLTSRTVDTIEKLNTTILAVPVRQEAAALALKGLTGVTELNDYRGVPSLMAYGPVDLDSLRWGVIAKMDQSEAMAPLSAYAKRVVVWGVGIALLATLMALLLAKALTRPINELVRAAKQVSLGELDVRVELLATDEYRDLGDAFNEMVISLRTNRAELDHQVLENERLLVSLLPASGAAQMRDGNAQARQSFADVTVAYINLVGFESLPPDLGEDDSMGLLSDIVAACDEAAEQQGVEKVRTIGSSYLAVSGLSVERPDHTARMVEFAREVVRIVRRFNAERGVHLVAEIGINAGPVIGGLVGRRKFIYDLWGDTVKLARGIESDGKTSIRVTRPVYERVRDLVKFGAETSAEVRGMGSVELFSILNEATV